MQTTLSPQQQDQLSKLTVPFHPDDISWRVTNTTQDKKRGCVIPYGDQRAYTDRLNAIFTPAGWTRSYEVTTLSPVTRTKRDKAIVTGKIIVTCVVSIEGLGSHTGSGEMWADDENAMTRAEAQAFKRACSCYGLGRYFYNFAEMWVELDKYGKPASLPTLPKWALPEGVVPISQQQSQRTQTRSQPAGNGMSQVAAEVVPPARQQENQKDTERPLDPKLNPKIEGYRAAIGDALYFEVFKAGGVATNARELPHLRAQQWVLKQLETLDRGIERVRELAQELQEQVFFGVLDHHKVQSIDKVPSFAVLKELVRDLQSAAGAIAA